MSSKTASSTAKSTSSRTASSSAKKSERLELAMAISNIVSKQDAFAKSVEVLQKFQSETLIKLDLEINSKKIDLENLADEYKRKQKDGQIETDQFLAEYKYNGAINIIKDADEVSIRTQQLQNMKDDLKELRRERTQEIEDIKKKEKDHAHKALSSALSNCELKHKAEVAESTASVTQQKKEISNLESTIKNLQHELAEQRKLTKDVAEASRQGAVTVNSAK